MLDMKRLRLRNDAQQIATAALRAVDAERLVFEHLTAHPSDATLIAGAGKAVAPMVRAAIAVLGERITGGIVAVPEGYDDDIPSPIERHITAHPLPDTRSLHAGRCVRDRVREAGADARWLGLWSGGASAALEWLIDGVSLEDLRATTAQSMRRGESIAQLQHRRRALSALKGGKLAEMSRARWHNLVLSDVRGDDPALVGGGPTVRPGDGSVVIGTLSMALDAARTEAFALRYVPVVLDAEVDEEAREVAERLGSAVRALADGSPPTVLLLAGEPVVSGVPEGAMGGRMQELALNAALAIAGLPAVVLTLATDGRDGVSPMGTAGGLVDGQTESMLYEMGIDIDAALAGHRSHDALDAVGALYRVPPTRTNVRDLVIALVDPLAQTTTTHRPGR